MQAHVQRRQDGKFTAVVREWTDLNPESNPPDPFMGFKVIAEVGVWQIEANALEAARLWIKDQQEK